MLKYILGLGVIVSIQAKAQNIAIGEWRDHFPFEKGLKVAHGNNVTYCATEFAMFSYDHQTEQVTRISKTNLISDVGVSAIAYDNSSNTLIVGYSNGNVDLLRENKTINLPFIKLNTAIVGSKKINHVQVSGALAYLSCGFGIVVVDLSRDEIKETYIIGQNNAAIEVFGTIIYNDSIFAVSEDGLYKAHLDEPFLLDFNNWYKDQNLPIPMVNGPLTRIMEQDDHLFVTYDNAISNLYTRQSMVWSAFTPTVGMNINSINTFGNDLMVCRDDTVKIYSHAGTETGEYELFSLKPRDAMAFTANDVVVASETHGLVHYDLAGKYLIKPDGPKGIGAFNMDAQEESVWVVGGGVTGTSWSNRFNQAALSGFIENKWRRYDLSTVPEFLLDTVYDFLAVAVDPDDPTHVFAGSLSYMGLIELKDNAYSAKYDENNSALQHIYDEPGVVAITDMTYDDDGNLWICNMKCSEQLVVLTETGTWKSFSLGNGQSSIVSRIVVDKSGYKWIASPSQGIWVYDDNGSITSTGDDQVIHLDNNIGTGNLPSLSIECLAVDLDGEIWVGTNEGPAVFYSPESIFDNNAIDAQQILIEQDGNLQLLLETEKITAIEVDGANRKWIGTQNSGVFLMSEDGTEQIYHFTETNSPLLSNEIISIAIENESGEVYFGTSSGIISFRGTATKGDQFFSDVYAFPNPVNETYRGPITIKGLARDSDVKITDVSGRVVFFTTSYGGQAIWNGNNMEGQRAQTGVYLVFATDENGQFSEVTKILFVN